MLLYVGRLYSWTSSMQLPCHGMVQYPLAVVIWCMIVQYIAVFSWSLALPLKMGWNYFYFFIFLPWCYMKLCYHKLFLQRVLFTPWPQLLICKKNIFCYYAVLLFSCGALQLKLVFGTITFIHCYFEVEAVLFHFGQFFFILVNSQWIDFFLIKLLHLQIYFWSPKICGTYSLKVCKV